MIEYRKGILKKQKQSYRTFFHKNKRYNNIIHTFDIETTSAYIDDNGITQPWNKSFNKEWIKNHKLVTNCYIWMASVNDVVYYGRYLEDFKTYLQELNEVYAGTSIIWVHNLAWEFQFLQNVFDFDNIFARKERKPIKANIDNLECEFRCSYTLTHKSLDLWSKDLPVQKKSGQLDYNVVRHSKSYLSPIELEYCEFDCLCVYHGIKTYVERYGNVAKIPLTQTGEVRLILKKIYQGDKSYHRHITSLLPDERLYDIFKRTFAGGYTHANYILTDMILEKVRSYDITSSYPAVLVMEEYPQAPFKPFPFIKKLLAKNVYILKVKFSNIDAKYANHYISKSKCEYVKNAQVDNGRIMYADELCIWITSADLEIIEDVYEYESMEILESYISRKARLDRRYSELILQLFNDKTQLKNVAGREEEYALSKQFLNSLFGMQSTDIVFNTVTHDKSLPEDEKWHTTLGDISASLAKQKKKVMSNTVAYQHGLFCTAYARRNLWSVLKEIDRLSFKSENDLDGVVYVDTDSIKFIGDYDYLFNEYNKKLVDRMDKALEDIGIDKEKSRPCSPDGKPQQLGIYTYEGEYVKFKTLGAKKYAYEDKDGLHITISGVPKGEVRQLKSLEDFGKGFIFDTECNDEKTSKNYTTYIDGTQESIKWIDYQGNTLVVDQPYGIHLQPTTYQIGISKDFELLLARRSTSRKGEI